MVNRFTLGDPALRPYANVQNDVAKMARHSLSAEGTVAITGPDEWSMVPMHPDQLKAGLVARCLGGRWLGRWLGRSLVGREVAREVVTYAKSLVSGKLISEKHTCRDFL